MLLARLADGMTLVLTWAAILVGFKRWQRLATAQRWFTIFLLGSGILGIASIILALFKINNWVVMNIWTLWLAITIGPTVTCRLPAKTRPIGRGLFLAWLAVWIIRRFQTGLGMWEGNMHPLLCGLILGIGMAAFDEILKEDLPLWQNGQAFIILGLSLMSVCDLMVWAAMQIYGPVNRDIFIDIWATRNLLLVPVSALYLRAVRVPT